MVDPTPNLIRVGYDGNLGVVAQWELLPGVTQYIAAVIVDGGTVLKSTTTPGMQAVFRLDAPLTADTAQVAVATDDGQQGPWGNRMTVLVDQIGDLVATYDHGTISSSWTLGGMSNGAMLQLSDAQGNPLAPQQSVIGTSTSFPVPPTLPAGAVLTANPTFGGSVGRTTTLPLVTQVAQVQAVQYDPTKPGLNVAFVGPVPGSCRPRGTLYADGVPGPAALGGVGLLVQIPLPGPLDPGTAWTVQTAWQADGAVGPSARPTDVMVATPSISSAEILPDGRVSLAWDTLPGPPYATGGQVTLTPTSGSGASSGIVTGADAGTITPSPALVAGATYATTVATARGTSVGAPGPAVTLVNVATAIASATYDGRTLTVTWAGADPSGATACRVELLEGATIVASGEGDAGRASLRIALDPAATYVARLRWLSGVGVGPAGPTAPLITAAPVLRDVDGSTGRLFLTWDAPADPNHLITGYEAEFTASGRRQVVSLAGPSPQSVTIPSDIDLLTPFTVAVRAIGSGTVGPASPAIPVLRAVPRLRSAAYDGHVVAMEWDPVVGPVEGYVATLSVAGQATAVPVAGTTATFTPSSSLGDSGATVGVGVQRGVAHAGSTFLPLVVAPPVLGPVSFDGAQLSIAVTAPGTPSPAADGYRVELLRGDAVVDVVELPAGPTLTLPVAVSDPSLGHNVRVRARSGPTLGPAAQASVLLEPAAVRSAQVDAAIAVTVDAGRLRASGLTLQAALLVDGTRGTPQDAAADGTVSFVRPTTGASWAVVARATTSGAQGPWSAPMRIPLAAPTLTAAEVADGVVRVGWGVDAGIEHVVSLTSGGTVINTVRARGGHATLSVDPALSAAQIAIRQADGHALGPVQQTDLVLAGCPATTVTDVAGDNATVTWSAPAGPTPTAFVPVVCWEGSQRPLADQQGSSCAVPLAGIPAGASVGVRARAGVALGPIGNLAPIVLGRPSGLAVRWSGDRLDATWKLPEDPRVDGAVVRLTPGQGPAVTASVQAATWTTPLTAAAGAGATVSVAAVAGTGASAAGDPVDVIVAPPVVTRLGWDGETLSAEWTAPSQPAGIDRYAVTVHDGDLLVVSALVAATSVELPLPPATAGSRSLAVAALTPASRGPKSAPLTLPAAGGAPTAVIVDPQSGTATVHWTAAGTTTTGYLVQAFAGGVAQGAPQAVAAPATSVALTTSPVAFADLEVAIAVQATVGGVATTGPYGPRARVLTTPVTIRDVDFDGATVDVRWDPVAAAQGYALTVLAPSLPQPVGSGTAGAGQTNARVAVTLGDPTLDYQVVVQPVGAAGAGVRATAPLFAPGFYVRPAGTPAGAPSRVVHATTPALDPAAITVYLPDLGPIDPTKLPLAPAQSGASDVPFSLALAPANPSNLKYALTIAGGALRFDAGRSTLADAYRALLATAEQHLVTPQGILAIQQAIARLMPQTFDETLLYAYGLDPAAGCVDLRPGMVLRVAFSSFDLTAVSGAEKWSSGYTGGAVVDYDVGDLTSPNGWLVGFDAFVDWLVARGALSVPAPSSVPPQPRAADVVESGGADAADLSFPGFQQPFYRLLLPTAIQAPTSAAVSRTGQQFTIAAAPGWRQIDAATPVPGGGVSLAYFRGRTIVRPCIRVQVDGTEQTVPIGTTVGNLLDRFARRPPSADVAVRGVRLERTLGPAVLDPSAGYRADALHRVRLDWDGLVTWTGGDALGLPLLHGDRLSFGASR